VLVRDAGNLRGQRARARETAGWNYLAVIYGASTGPINCKDRCASILFTNAPSLRRYYADKEEKAA